MCKIVQGVREEDDDETGVCNDVVVDAVDDNDDVLSILEMRCWCHLA